MSLPLLFCNEDPLAKISLIISLRECWYCQLFLIASNLVGIYAIYLLFRMGFSMYGVSIVVAVLYSIGYHTCQSMGYCFLYTLTTWTILDHVSAPSMASMVAIFTVNSRTVDMIRATHEVLLTKMTKQKQQQQKKMTLNAEQQHTALDMSRTTESDHYNYYYSQLYMEENSTYDAWSATIVYLSIFVTFQAVMAHPFSMQSFIIVVAFMLAIVFFKVVIIDAGDITPTLKRVSLPELVTGIVLIAISLVFFVLDDYFPQQYWILHSLWHAFSFLGVAFYSLGLTKDNPGWCSPYPWFLKHMQRVRRTNARSRSLKN